MKEKQTVAAVFLALLAILGLSTFFLPKEERSEAENRPLATFPTLDFSSLWTGSFFWGIDSYEADHFVGRDGWAFMKGNLQYGEGIKESGGVFLGQQLMARLPKPDKDMVRANVAALLQVGEKWDNEKYVMLVPSASAIQPDRLPLEAEASITWDQLAYVDQIYGQLAESWQKVDVAEALLQRKEQDLYYRTDHHWNSFGAYTGAKALSSVLHFPLDERTLSDFQIVSGNFIGTLSRKSGYYGVRPDVIRADPETNQWVRKVILDTPDGEKVENSVYFPDYLSGQDQYCYFLGENLPLVTIETAATSPKKLLIFKDSYANSLIPFLTKAYSQITVVDLRYWNTSILEKINPKEYEQVLVLYSLDTFTSANDLSKMDWED